MKYIILILLFLFSSCTWTKKGAINSELIEHDMGKTFTCKPYHDSAQNIMLKTKITDVVLKENLLKLTFNFINTSSKTDFLVYFSEESKMRENELYLVLDNKKDDLIFLSEIERSHQDFSYYK